MRKGLRENNYIDVKLIFKQDQMEFIDYLYKKYGYSRYGYGIKVLDGDRRKTLIMFKKAKLDEVKFLCKHAGIIVKMEFEVH